MDMLANASKQRSGMATRRAASTQALSEPEVVNVPSSHSRRQANFDAYESSVLSHLEADASRRTPISAAAPASFDHPQEVVEASPVVVRLSALVEEQHRSLRELEELHNVAVSAVEVLKSVPQAPPDASQDLSACSAVQSGSSEPVNPLTEKLKKAEGTAQAIGDRISANRMEVQRTVAELEEARREQFFSPSHQLQDPQAVGLQRRVGPLDRHVKRISRLERLRALDNSLQALSAAGPPTQSFAATRAASKLKPSRSIKQELSDIRRLAFREHCLTGFYDKDERAAIRSAVDIKAEKRSPEPFTAHPLDKNGYEKNSFLVDDDDVFSTETESTDDDSCTSLSSCPDTDEDDDEVDRRNEIIAEAYRKTQSRTPIGEFLSLSCSAETAVELRALDVHVRRRTPRTDLIELILNNWLRADLRKLKLSNVSEFLRLMRTLPQEFAISVYYAVVKRIRPLSVTFFKFLYRCVMGYLPEQSRLLGIAYRQTRAKEKNSSASAQPIAEDIQRARKPTTRPPFVKDITDIDDAVGRFYNEYRAYARDHKGFPFKSVFDCLTPVQATSFASQSRKDESLLSTMDMESFMEVWRATFGFRSSAATLAAIKRVSFEGNVLDPAIWSNYHQRFVQVLHRAPTSHFPPSDKVAEVFIKNCGNDFLKEDVLAYEPQTHEEALQMVLDRLNNSGFLQSEALRSGNVVKLSGRFDGRRQDRDQGPRHDKEQGPRVAFQQREDPKFPKLPPRTKTFEPRKDVELCKRCDRPGHTEDSCVAKHNAKGDKLEKVEDAIYARRKANAVAIAAAKLKAVHAVLCSESESNPETSDLEAQLQNDSSDSSDVCCTVELSSDDDGFDDAFAIFHAREYFDELRFEISRVRERNEEHLQKQLAYIRDVPPPSLLLSGDIEPHPGPRQRKQIPYQPFSKRRVELLAIIVFQQYASIVAQTSGEMSSSPILLASAQAPFMSSTASHVPSCSPPMSPITASIAIYTAVVFFLIQYVLPTPNVERPSSPFSTVATFLRTMALSLSAVLFVFHSWNLPSPWRTLHESYTWPSIASFPIFVALEVVFLFRHFRPISDDVPAPSLLRCGDVASNPGPVTATDKHITLTPSARRPPNARRSTAFIPGDHTVLVQPTPSQASASVTMSGSHERLRSQYPPVASTVVTVPQNRPAFQSDSYTSASDAPAHLPTPHQSSTAFAPKTTNQRTMEVHSDIPSASSDPDLVTDPDDGSDSDDVQRRHWDVAAFLGASSSSNSDTSDIDAAARAEVFPSVCAAVPIPDFLPPPRFNGFLRPPSSSGPPPESSAQVCAVDTMCQGTHSIISQDLVDKLSLPTRPYSRTCRTANGAKVACTHVAEFLLVVRILDAWVTVPATALVWEKAAEPILISNKLALDSGLIDFCSSNDYRVPMFGPAAFSTNWQHHVDTESQRALAIYHEDFMPEECDDFVDLSAPLKQGDQDISSLPPDALKFAKRFPMMTKAIPKDAHPGLPKWRANITESAIPLYSWPPVHLKDLKEEKLPFKVIPQLHKEFDKLIEMHYAEELKESPNGVAMRAQLVAKSKTERRFCVNGSMLKNIMQVATYPMPHIRSILSFVASFAFRAKVDCKHGYHNFEVHPDDRKWTTTIGAGRAITWRKLVQGFASSGAFFQFAMCNLLGDRVWRICAVYLDDIIVVGHTVKECADNVLDIMTVLNEFRFRINFAKCAFTPSTDIDFLGCSLRGNLVHPGPKVSTMLSKIRPPHLQFTPKSQRHHLHVFLGCCAFIMQHCPGLKQTLAPLYLSVASDPFVYGDNEKKAFDEAMTMLTSLQPFHLPSHDPDVVVEIFTDASGGTGTPQDPGAWAAALGQRTGVLDMSTLQSAFHLLQVDGGIFNSRQASWDVLKKEGFALFQALHRFRQYVYGRRVRIFTDSKVLMHMFRSESPVLKRWYAYLQTFDFEMIHIPSENNALVDCLSRYVAVPQPAVACVPKLLAAVKAVPAPPLLRCGDVESNPGPNSNDDQMVIEVSSSASSPDIVAPVSTAAKKRPTRKHDTSSPSLHTTDVANPISTQSRSLSSSSPLIATPQRSRSRRSPGTTSLPTSTTLVAPAAHEDDTAPVVLDESPPAIYPPDDHGDSDLVWFQVHNIGAGPSSICDAASEALEYEAGVSQDARSLVIPFRPLDVRERVGWFYETNSSKPMSCLRGLSFQQYFRANTPLLRFADRDDTHTPTSWQEYKTLINHSTTFPDNIFVHAVAVVYGAQIVLFTDNEETFIINPANAFRRIFLFGAQQGAHFNWGHRQEPLDLEHPGRNFDRFSFKDVPLFSSQAYTPRPLRFPKVLDIPSERMQAIHAAHCAYTGHPGVEATVKALQKQGQTWRRMTAHVSQFIRKCPTCCASRLRLQHAPITASSLRLTSRPLRRWHLDQTGSMGECVYTGFTRILLFVCEATQFCAMYGSRFGTALEAAIAFIHLMGWTGTAESLHSDGGPEFDNYIWHQLTQITGIKHSFSVPYVPQSNGLAERNIAEAKRFVRMLTVDLDKHNSWGLLLPIAQKGLNDLRRQELQWYSPNEIVFVSLCDANSFVIPTFYTRHLRALDILNANEYDISANFVHRAMCFQQFVINQFHEAQAQAFDAAATRDPVAHSDLLTGQCVLIDWPDNSPPSPAHPTKRGPYKVLGSHTNTVTLQHFDNPPPADQPYLINWSKHAHVYFYPEDEAPRRSQSDPAASQASLGTVGRQIDCVISHITKPVSDRVGDSQQERQFHVKNQLYQCRLFMHNTDTIRQQLSSRTVNLRYEEICHTFAFDSYFQANRNLTGHVAVSCMPANWCPHAVSESQRPSFPPLPLHEQTIPRLVNDENGSASD